MSVEEDEEDVVSGLFLRCGVVTCLPVRGEVSRGGDTSGMGWGLSSEILSMGM